jgi:hypothetical protein
MKINLYYSFVHIKGKVVLSLINWLPRHENVWESGGIALGIINLGIGWRWVVRFTPWSLYLRRNVPLVTWTPHLVCTLRGKKMSGPNRNWTLLYIVTINWQLLNMQSNSVNIIVNNVVHIEDAKGHLTRTIKKTTHQRNTETAAFQNDMIKKTPMM